MADLEVDYDALMRAAGKLRAVADGVGRAEVHRAASPLARGAFGKLPQSEELYQAYADQDQTVADALSELENVYDLVADALKATVDLYVGADDAVAQALEAGTAVVAEVGATYPVVPR